MTARNISKLQPEYGWGGSPEKKLSISLKSGKIGL